MTDQSVPQVPPGWHVEPGTGLVRWWDGRAWGVYQQAMQPAQVAQVAQVVPVQSSLYAAGAPTQYPQYAAPAVQNGFAVAALVLGIWGFVTTWIPLFIGLFLGGIPDMLAIVFGILGITRAGQLGGRGQAMAIVGVVLGALAFLSIFVGAGTIW